MLKYALRENLLTAQTDDYMAQTVDARSYSGEEIVELMLKRGSTLTKADAAAAVELYNTVCAELIADGCNLNTPLMNTSLSVSGVFSGANDSFDPSRHAIKLNIAPGTLLREAAGKVRAEKTQAASTDPYITAVRDVVSGEVNGTLTAGAFWRPPAAASSTTPPTGSRACSWCPQAGPPSAATWWPRTSPPA